jgi:hypothetical protein
LIQEEIPPQSRGTLTVNEMAKINRETSRAIAKTSTPVLNVFRFRFLRATEKNESCAMLLSSYKLNKDEK